MIISCEDSGLTLLRARLVSDEITASEGEKGSERWGGQEEGRGELPHMGHPSRSNGLYSPQVVVPGETRFVTQESITRPVT